MRPFVAEAQTGVGFASTTLRYGVLLRRMRVWGGRLLRIYLPGAVLAGIVVACFLGPVVADLPSPNAQQLLRVEQGLGTAGHPLGTDSLGRDILSRVLHGGRVSLMVGVAAVVIGLVVGGLMGVLAGYLRSWRDTVISRFVDILLAFPPLILQMTIAMYLGASIRNVTIALAVYTVPTYTRLARAGALAIRERNFVASARLSGARTWHIVLRHVVPNVMNSLVSYGLLALSTSIILAASLSFLGLGIQPPQADWGGMIAEGKESLEFAPHIVMVPGAFLFLTVMSLSMLNDAMRSRASRLEGEL